MCTQCKHCRHIGTCAVVSIVYYSANWIYALIITQCMYTYILYVYVHLILRTYVYKQPRGVIEVDSFNLQPHSYLGCHDCHVRTYVQLLWVHTCSTYVHIRRRLTDLGSSLSCRYPSTRGTTPAYVWLVMGYTSSSVTLRAV